MVKTYFEDEEDRRRYWRQLKRMQRQRKKGIMSKSMSFRMVSISFSFPFTSHRFLASHCPPFFKIPFANHRHSHLHCPPSCLMSLLMSSGVLCIKNIHQCPLMSSDVLWCLMMPIDVLWCQSMLSHVLCLYWRLLMSPDDNPCPLLSSIFVVFIVVISCLFKYSVFIITSSYFSIAHNLPTEALTNMKTADASIQTEMPALGLQSQIDNLYQLNTELLKQIQLLNEKIISVSVVPFGHFAE